MPRHPEPITATAFRTWSAPISKARKRLHERVQTAGLQAIASFIEKAKAIFGSDQEALAVFLVAARNMLNTELASRGYHADEASSDVRPKPKKRKVKKKAARKKPKKRANKKAAAKKSTHIDGRSVRYARLRIEADEARPGDRALVKRFERQQAA